MENIFSIDPFIIKGWTLQKTADLPKNKLNEGAQIYLTYKNRLSLRTYEKYFRLMIQAQGDERCFQIEFGNKLDAVIQYIFSSQDDLSLNTYFTHYLAIQQICPVSILAIEQFL